MDEMPSKLAGEIAEYETVIGQPAAADLVRPGWWRVTYADTHRVRCTVDYAARSGAGYEWMSSELRVDGVRRCLTDGPQGLAAVLRDPDACRLRPVEAHNPADGDVPVTVPAVVRHHVKLLALKLARYDPASVEAVHNMPDVWRVYANVGDGEFVILLTFTAARHHAGRASGWALANHHAFVAFFDGSAEVVAGGMAAVLALLGRTQPNPQGHPKVAGPAPTARQGSVEVRRASVIRV